MSEKSGVVIWGTGDTAIKLLTEIDCLKPDYYIDNDIKKCGSIFHGRQIKHPSDTGICWNDKWIIVASIYYKEIFLQLNQLGLIENVDYINSNSLCLRQILLEDFESALIEKIDFVTENLKTYKNKSILFFCLSPYDAEKRGLGHFFENWSNMKESSNLILAQEATWLTQKVNQGMTSIPVLELPFFLAKGRYMKRREFYISNNRLACCNIIELSKEARQYVNDRAYLHSAAQNLRLKYDDMAEQYEYLLLFYIDQYIRKLFKIIKPSRVYLWNQFYAVHMVIREICMEMEISTRYFEFGNLPGTIQVDIKGQMGASWPAQYGREFKKMPVSYEELQYAKKIWHYLYLSKDNRKKQPKTTIWKYLDKKINLGNPIVLYAGQNDYESGLQPYTEESELYHSPIFHSSDEGAVAIAEICQRNNWNLIYKPHPIMCRNKTYNLFPQNVILIEEADINEVVELADVVVTILSTTAYTALLRKKPTVMMGYTQLKDKGCTYECFKRENLERTLAKALDQGFDSQTARSFLAHIAQMCKYYLYDDLCDKNVRFGKTLDKAKEYVEEKNTWRR